MCYTLTTYYICLQCSQRPDDDDDDDPANPPHPPQRYTRGPTTINIHCHPRRPCPVRSSFAGFASSSSAANTNTEIDADIDINPDIRFWHITTVYDTEPCASCRRRERERERTRRGGIGDLDTILDFLRDTVRVLGRVPMPGRMLARGLIIWVVWRVVLRMGGLGGGEEGVITELD